MIGFLDFSMVVLVVVGLTQVLLPFIFRSKLEYFWFFKRKAKVEQVVEKKQILEGEIREVKEESELNLKQAEEINNKTKQL